MANAIEISEAAYNGHFAWIVRAFYSDGNQGGVASNTSDPSAPDTLLPYAAVIVDPTDTERANIETAAANYNPTLTLTADPVAGEVALAAASSNVRCYLWLDNKAQGRQDDFTAGDLTLTGLNVPGVYRVLAYNVSTYESGYIEMEVT